MNQPAPQYEIRIRKGDHVFTIKRSELVVCSEAPDGIAFQFKNGMHVLYTDNFLPTHAKMKIKLTVDQMVNGNIEINLDNYNSPVSLSM